jgi:hypothetical protein
MDKTPISIAASRQVPEYIRDNYGKFVDFIRAYYKFVDASESIQNLEDIRSIETTPEDFISQFKKEMSALFPTKELADERFVLQRLAEFYKTRGSEESYKFLFRAFFNEDVDISYPSQNLLRASDGNWEQYSFITVTTITGVLPSNEPTLTIVNEYGSFELYVTSLIKINPTTTRLYFKSISAITFADNQIIKCYGVTGAVLYQGKLIKSPWRLNILNAGQGWLRGQAFFVTRNADVGENVGQDTVARVSEVGSNGEMLGVEVMEHGYIHDDKQQVFISPYPNKPSGAQPHITKTLYTSPNRVAYNITLEDSTDGTTESVIGVTDNSRIDPYFAEDYVVQGYIGHLVISFTSTIGRLIITPQAAGLTQQQWFDSIAELQYEFANVIKTTGRYVNDSGQLSNQEMRLQDSYFYQLFSYLIQTERDVSEYSDLLTVIHPAGMKSFSQLIKQVNTEFPVTTTRSLNIDLIQFFDGLFIDSRFSNGLSKKFSETKTATDAATTRLIGKGLVDAKTATDTTPPKRITKVKTETLTSSETHRTTINKSLPTESLTATESRGMTLTKPSFTESMTAYSSETAAYSQLGYALTGASGYCADDYAALVKTLNIGQ